MTARRLTRFAALVAPALLLGACGGDDETSPDAAAAVLAELAREDAGGATIDACTLLSDAEAAEALGGPVVGHGPAAGVGESVCGWETDGGWSLAVSVGSPGTAPGDRFEPTDMGFGAPEPVPGLANASYVGLGVVEVAAGERHNAVQVVSARERGADREAAERLAALVAERVAAAG